MNRSAKQQVAKVQTLTHIKDLVPDPKNRRQHNPRNIGMVVDALHEVGAARSIVIDEDNVVLAGNGVLEAAGEAGITRLRVIEADGQELIAVRRSGLSEAQKRHLAIADNRSAELAQWNAVQFRDDLGAGLGFGQFFNPEELSQLTGAFAAAEAEAPVLSSADRAHYQQMTFTLHDDQVQTVKDALTKAQADGCDSAQNENTNGNALAYICEVFFRG